MTSELITSVDINATPERVWEVLTDLPAYPQWNPFIISAEGTFEVGGRPSLSLPPLNALLRTTLRPTVLDVIPCRRLQFQLTFTTLRMPGLFDTDHTLTVTPHDGGVRLRHQVRFRGLLVPLMIRRLPGFTAMNAALKDQVEGARATPAQGSDRLGGPVKRPPALSMGP